MQANRYTPGYSAPVLDFMKARSAETHAEFFLPRLKPGFRMRDAGCGPGTITLGLARKVAPGNVIGIDIEDSQFASACERVEREALPVEFRKASIYELPFESQSFDAVFSHAVLQHLGDPLAGLSELRRVLKPGGVIGLRAGDSGGTLIDAESEGSSQGLAAYIARRQKDGGDPYVGRKLGRLLRQAGFKVEQVTASYEVVSDLLQKIGPSLAAHFAPPGYDSQQAKFDDSLFVALAWCEAVGTAV